MCLIKATEDALELIGDQYKTLLILHLKTKHHSGLEMVSSEQGEFHRAVSELFGEYSAKILEDLIMECMTKDPSVKVQKAKDFSDFIKKVNKAC